MNLNHFQTPPTPPESTPPPYHVSSQLQNFIFYLFFLIHWVKLMLLIHMTVGLSTGVWSPAGTIPLQIADSSCLSSHQPSIASQLEGRAHEPLSLHAGLLSGLTACRQPQLLWFHSCNGLSHPEDTVLSWSLATADFYNLKPLLLQCLLSLAGRAMIQMSHE